MYMYIYIKRQNRKCIACSIFYEQTCSRDQHPYKKQSIAGIWEVALIFTFKYYTLYAPEGNQYPDIRLVFRILDW